MERGGERKRKVLKAEKYTVHRITLVIIFDFLIQSVK